MLDIIKPHIEVYADESNPNRADFVVEPSRGVTLTRLETL